MTVAGDDADASFWRSPRRGWRPGQTAVVYEGDQVVVAGTIASTERWAGADRVTALKKRANWPVV